MTSDSRLELEAGSPNRCISNSKMPMTIQAYLKSIIILVTVAHLPSHIFKVDTLAFFKARIRV
jgi:hypothetical protein